MPRLLSTRQFPADLLWQSEQIFQICMGLMQQQVILHMPD